MTTNGTLAAAPRILAPEELRRKAPSIFATELYHAVSDSYRFLPTINVLDIFRDRRYFPVKAMQSTTRLLDEQPFTKHLERLRYADFITPQPVGVDIPERSCSTAMIGPPPIGSHPGYGVSSVRMGYSYPPPTSAASA